MLTFELREQIRSKYDDLKYFRLWRKQRKIYRRWLRDLGIKVFRANDFTEFRISRGDYVPNFDYTSPLKYLERIYGKKTWNWKTRVVLNFNNSSHSFSNNYRNHGPFSPRLPYECPNPIPLRNNGRLSPPPASIFPKWDKNPFLQSPTPSDYSTATRLVPTSTVVKCSSANHSSNDDVFSTWGNPVHLNEVYDYDDDTSTVFTPPEIRARSGRRNKWDFEYKTDSDEEDLGRRKSDSDSSTTNQFQCEIDVDGNFKILEESEKSTKLSTSSVGSSEHEHNNSEEFDKMQFVYYSEEEISGRFSPQEDDNDKEDTNDTENSVQMVDLTEEESSDEGIDLDVLDLMVDPDDVLPMPDEFFPPWSDKFKNEFAYQMRKVA